MKNKNSEEVEINKLGQSIYLWLNYHQTVSNTDFLLESSIRFPLVEYLERFKDKKDKILAEVTHPILQGKKRIDFLYESNTKKKYFELKYIKEAGNNTTAIFNDIIRSALCSAHDKDCDCYFICCGKKNWFDEEKKTNKIIIIEQNTPQSNNKNAKPQANWFSFDRNNRDKEFVITKEEEMNFKTYYNFNEEITFCQIKTSLCFLQQDTISIGIWKITTNNGG